MTHQEKLEAVRQACIKANPSIMELGFGCECEAKGYKMQYVEFNNNQHSLLVTKNQALLVVDKLGEGITVIGRPIRLTDVLLAIAQNTRYTVPCEIGLEREKNNLYFAHTGNNFRSSFSKWNLLKDDLREQSEETIDFLYQLICK